MKSVQHGTGCGLEGRRCHGPGPVPQDQPETCICTDHRRAGIHTAPWEAKPIQIISAERKKAQRAVNIRRLLLQHYSSAPLLSSALTASTRHA